MNIRRTIAHLSHYRASQSAEAPSARLLTDDGVATISWGETFRRASELAMGLYALGARKGERIAIISDTRYEWTLCDSAVLSFGGVVVGIYPTSTADQMAYILRHSECRFAFLEDQKQFQKLSSVELPAMEQMIIFDSDGLPEDGWISLDSLAGKGRELLAQQPGLPDELRDAVVAEDIASLVYTSGTTGPPKGVVLRHRNLYDIAQDIKEFLPLAPPDTGTAFLPMAHILQRVNGYVSSSAGISGCFITDLTRLVEGFKRSNPTVISGVPRVFEKMHAAIFAGIEQAAPRRKKLLKKALALGVERSRCIQQSRPVPLMLRLQTRLYDKLVYSKIRAGLFGDQIRYMTSGAAPLGMAQLEFFHAIGIPIYEGYGLTETSSPITLNGPSAFKFGTVGRPFPGSQVKIAEDGEILLKGPGVFSEYYKDPEATIAAFTEDGWFKSGDIGQIDDDGFLTITDRKKNLIITAGGKNVAPAILENLIMSDPYIGQVMAYGDRRRYVTALIILDEEAIMQWAKDRGKEGLSYQALTQDEEVQLMVAAAVDKGNQQLARFEQIKYFRIVPEELTVSSGMLTPTYKLKRGAVIDKYAHLIEEMYDN